MIDFDAWRADYDQMTYEDQSAFYDRVWASYPVQQHYDAKAVSRFIDTVVSAARPARVLEFGGWRGELAAEMLGYWGPGVISEWMNVEICRGAAGHPVVNDLRYEAVVPGMFPWEFSASVYNRYDTLVMSHVIEHMKTRELWALLGKLTRVRHAFIASPLDLAGRDWTGYNGSHILEIGWTNVISMMGELGFRHEAHHDTSEVRVFSRVIA